MSVGVNRRESEEAVVGKRVREKMRFKATKWSKNTLLAEFQKHISTTQIKALALPFERNVKNTKKEIPKNTQQQQLHKNENKTRKMFPFKKNRRRHKYILTQNRLYLYACTQAHISSHIAHIPTIWQKKLRCCK